jgi:hypothetical protein
VTSYEEGRRGRGEREKKIPITLLCETGISVLPKTIHPLFHVKIKNKTR